MIVLDVGKCRVNADFELPGLGLVASSRPPVPTVAGLSVLHETHHAQWSEPKLHERMNRTVAVLHVRSGNCWT